MTLYCGETILIKHSATYDGTVLTNVDMQTVTITIFDSEGEVVEEEIPMVWDAVKIRWWHSWDTSPGATPGGTFLDPGTYRVKVYTLSIDGAENWEFSKIKLKINPV